MFLRFDRIIYFLLSVLETLISFRFIFKLFGASSSNNFVNWLYNVTDIFIAPFEGIFRDFAAGRFVIDLTAIMGLVVYSFAGFIIIEILRLFKFEKNNKFETQN